MVMSELSLAELQAESVELLPERETLGIVIVPQVAIAVGSHNTAENVYQVNSDNTNHSYDGNLGSFNTVSISHSFNF
jgi:hypothetical protein